jgi:hypothetical protein
VRFAKQLSAAGTVVLVVAIAAGPSRTRAPLSRAERAAIQVSVQGPSGDPLFSAIPLFVIRALDAVASDRPLTLTLQVSERADFSGTALFERIVQGDSARISTDRPLREGRTIFWRAHARSANGQDFISAFDGPRTTATWLRLVTPNAQVGATLDTRRPLFRWSSAAVPSPPGPWEYVLSIENLASHATLRFGPMRDSTFVPPVDLESNTSYRWSVAAGLPTGDTTVVRSLSSFVIVDVEVPRVTLLYQNFPNPFPTTTSATTCVWFDLHLPSRVSLTIHDVRGNLVRTLIPSPVLRAPFLAGRFGRGTPGTTPACDPDYLWDGRADSGRMLSTGVYLLRLKTETYEAVKKIVFRGR